MSAPREHFTDIEVDSKDADWQGHGHDEIPQTELAGPLLLRGLGHIGLSVEENWQDDEANTANAAPHKRQDQVHIGEQRRQPDNSKWDGDSPHVKANFKARWCLEGLRVPRKGLAVGGAGVY